MVRYAVGYQSRAFVTFGTPIPLSGYDAESRRDVMALAHLMRDDDRQALQGAADGGRRRGDAAVDRPGGSSRRAAEAIIEALAAAGANMGVRSGREAVEAGAEPLAASQHHPRRARRPLPGPRAHRAPLLRAHAPAPARGTATSAPHALMFQTVSKTFFDALAGSGTLKHLASRYGMRRPGSFARRFIAGETVGRSHRRGRAPSKRPA